MDVGSSSSADRSFVAAVGGRGERAECDAGPILASVEARRARVATGHRDPEVGCGLHASAVIDDVLLDEQTGGFDDGQLLIATRTLRDDLRVIVVVVVVVSGLRVVRVAVPIVVVVLVVSLTAR